MSSVSRRIVPATLALALAVVPTTALHARPADVEGDSTSWTAVVFGVLSDLFDVLGPDEEPRPPASAAAPSGDEEPDSQELGPWWDPNGGSADALLSRPVGELGPWWDPNG